MNGQQVAMQARDGFSLSATFFAAASPPAPLVILASATAVRQSYYHPFAGYLAENGLNVLTFDYRGVGGSRPEKLKGFVAQMHEWGELDLAGAIDWAKSNLDPSRIFFVGHSVAGQMFPLAENNALIEKALFVGSQSGYWKNWSGGMKIKVLLLWGFIIPLATAVLGYFPGWILGGEPLPAGVARQWARWGRRRNYILTHAPDVAAKFAGVKIPLRFVYFPDDDIAPPAAVHSLAGWYGSTDKEIVEITPAEVGVERIGHFGFFRERFRDTLWAGARDWLMRDAG